MRLNITAVGVVPNERLVALAQQNTAKRAGKQPPHGRRLAVVGSGPSLAVCLDELRSWGGDIWAINYTGNWLRERGIESILYTVDSMPLTNIHSRRAVLASSVHPDTIAQAEEATFFDLSEVSDSGIIGGTTSATRAPMAAIHLGYTDVSFYGCDGSFAERTHVDRDDTNGEQVIVRAAGADYRTNLQMLLQCEELTNIISAFPDVFHNRSGGLLAAMLMDAEWEIIAVSEALKEHLEQLNGDQGMFTNRYERAS